MLRKFHLHAVRKSGVGRGAGEGEKKDADAICKTPTGEGRTTVIEEVEGGREGGDGDGGVKVGKANFVIACDSPEARGTQSAVKIRK